MRVLKWIAERTSGATEARKTPIGFVPNYQDLSWEGLEFTADQFDALMAIDANEWTAECESQYRYFEKFGDVTPQKMEAQRQLTAQRIKDL